MTNKLINLVAVGIILPSTAIANNVSAREVEVNTPNVRAITRSDGSIKVNSGETTVEVPRRSSRSWNPFRYWSLPWQNYQDNRRVNCRQSSYQTSKTTPSGIVQSSTSRHSCN